MLQSNNKGSFVCYSQITKEVSSVTGADDGYEDPMQLRAAMPPQPKCGNI